MTDIRAFLTARWDNLHLQAVDRMENGPTRTVYQLGGGTEQVREGVGYWRYVLDDLAAKRAILARIADAQSASTAEDAIEIDWYLARDLLRMLAHPFRAHPDFDPAWRIEP